MEARDVRRQWLGSAQPTQSTGEVAFYLSNDSFLSYWWRTLLIFLSTWDTSLKTLCRLGRDVFRSLPLDFIVDVENPPSSSHDDHKSVRRWLDKSPMNTRTVTFCLFPHSIVYSYGNGEDKLLIPVSTGLASLSFEYYRSTQAIYTGSE